MTTPESLPREQGASEAPTPSAPTAEMLAQVSATLKQALRLPLMPFPDPAAHSTEAYARAVHAAFCAIRFKVIDALAALARSEPPTGEPVVKDIPLPGESFSHNGTLLRLCDEADLVAYGDARTAGALARTIPEGWKLIRNTTDAEREWTEDAKLENGAYFCRCIHCSRQQSRGHHPVSPPAPQGAGMLIRLLAIAPVLAFTLILAIGTILTDNDTILRCLRLLLQPLGFWELGEHP